MAKKLRGQADILWIAGRLKKEPLDKTFVRRFTFDGDLIAEHTLYPANPSWTTLKAVVEGQKVQRGHRDALAKKIKGLLAERAAARLVVSPAFARRYFGDTHKRLFVRRGVGYGADSSIDVMVLEEEGKALFVEVKNWSARSWDDKRARQKALRQLERHNDGVAEVLASTRRELAGKILLISDEGYITSNDLDNFEFAVKRQGWIIEILPSADLGDFTSFIDDLK